MMNSRDLMVGRRGEAPLVPPYRFPQLERVPLLSPP